MRERKSFPYACRPPVGLGIFVCQVAKSSQFHGGVGGFPLLFAGGRGYKGRMKQVSKEREAVKLLAVTLSNFSAISFGIGVFEKDATGLVAGCYALALALLLVWRIAE